MADIVRSWDKAIEAGLDRLKRRGQIGRINASGNPTVEVPGTNGRLVYVRLGGGADGVIEAVPRNVSRRAHTYVKVHREDGIWIAVADDSAINQNGGGDGGAPHTHRRGSGNEFIWEAELFAPGVVLPSSGLTVSIGSFRYPNGVSGETYTGGTIDLTSHVPGTANKWRWVIVGVDPATNAAVAVSGSDFDTQAELTRAEIDNVAFDGYIPLAAIQVANGDTALTDHSRYYDARPWFVPSRGQTDYTFDLNSEGAIVVTNANTGNAATAGIRLESDVSMGQLFATGENYAANGWADAIVAVTNAAGGFIWQSSNIRLQNFAGTDVMQVTTGDVLISGDLFVPNIYGANTSGANLTLNSTSNVTKGQIIASDEILANAGITFGDEPITIYDEGTWTPAITGSSSNPTVTYTKQEGWFRQLNDLVFYTFAVVIATISGGSGNIRISIPSANGSGVQPAIATVRTGGVDIAAGAVTLHFLTEDGMAFGSVRATIDDGSTAPVQVSAVSNGDFFLATGYYRV